MPFFCLALFLLFSTCSKTVALMNMTVDDKNPLIQYHPPSSWEEIKEPTDFNGTHMLTTDNIGNVYAIITYTCVSIYFMYPLWPYAVSTGYSIDGQPTVIVNLRDPNAPFANLQPATASSRVMSSFLGTTSTEHTVRVFIPPGGQQGIVDAIIFEVQDPSSTTPTTTSDLSVTTSQTTTSSNAVITTASSQSMVGSVSAATLSSTMAVTPTSSQHAIYIVKVPERTIGMGIGIGLFSLLVLLLLWRLCLRRANGRPKNNGNRANFTIDPSDSNIWEGTAAPVTATHEGADGVQYRALPLGEAPVYPSAAALISQALYDDPSQLGSGSEDPPPYNNPIQTKNGSKWSFKKGDGFERTSSNDGSDAVVAPAISNASAYSDGREIPNFEEKPLIGLK